jgi:esterase/lipase superfamily enzyme
VVELLEGREVAPRAAAEVEDAIRSLAAEMLEQRVAILAHVVVARALPEALGVLVIVTEREG